MKECSLHFIDDDYFYRDSSSTQKKCLKKTAMHSRNLPVGSTTTKEEPECSSSRSERLKQRNIKKKKLDCHQFKIKLIRPPFSKDKKQLSTEEALLNAKIAAARVHIERVNQRIKIFKILGGKLQWSLVKKVEDIFTIACAVTNLSNSIFAEHRFLRNKIT
ncbi:uncharacterized protein LOC123671718 [Harmonia axyridis]|uniref:uncharacterized protein LOC123671718 n=1 Tax=Harmonia axyridis TaxID=115357 RepID=UPI001E2750A1|nr:uncharacterized protein LOC123671718 [Harmonia axyridis]